MACLRVYQRDAGISLIDYIEKAARAIPRDIACNTIPPFGTIQCYGFSRFARIQVQLPYSAGIALGGVASKPWRVRDAEQSLAGRPADLAAFQAAAEIALVGAQPLSQNGFKVDLAKHSIVRTLRLAADGPQSRKGGKYE